MPGASAQAPSNAQILRVIESISSDVAELKKQQQRIERNLERLVKRHTG
jgi:hypothetical protein